MVNYIVTHSFLFKEYFSFKRPQISVKGLQWIKTEHKLKRNVFFVFLLNLFTSVWLTGPRLKEKGNKRIITYGHTSHSSNIEDLE